MARTVIHKKAKAWVWEMLSNNPNLKGIYLFDRLQAKFTEGEVPTRDHTVRAWMREFHEAQKNNVISKNHSMFDPIETFNDPMYRDLFTDADKEFCINFISDLGTSYYHPRGTNPFIQNGVILWVNKLKNTMPILVDNPIDLYLFAQGFATLEARPDSEADVEQAKRYLYSQAYYSRDKFDVWADQNKDQDRSLPVNIHEYIDLEDMKSDEGNWWHELPSIIASNFAIMPSLMPHIKVLYFVHGILNNHFVSDLDSPVHDHADKEMFEEVKKNISRVGSYLDKVVHQGVSPSREHILPKLHTYDPIELGPLTPSKIFNWYYALLINCYTLAQSGGKFMNGLTVTPYDELQKYEQLFTEEYKKKHWK